MHDHREAQEIWYVLEGEGQMQVGDEICDIAPGDLVYGPKQVMHQIINNRDEKDLKALLILCPGGDEENVVKALAQGKGVVYQSERN
jgi:mannose-6-phosphate isomerase-like protein (cupin superfamily)